VPPLVALDAQNVIILVFAMDGCPACEHYVPRLLSEAEALRAEGYPFVVYTPGMPLAPRTIPIVIYDAATPDSDVQKLADRYAVRATPTTIVVTRGSGGFKCEGSLANNQARWLLLMANEVNR
jgi:thiol-disulfide isomerase/thioredoxin